MIERTSYLQKLIKLKDQNLIKVVTGVRRCGKSTLLQQYQQKLGEQGVPAQNIVAVDLDLLKYEELREYHNLHDYFKSRLAPQGTTYIFIDEVQRCPQFEEAVESLFAQSNTDLYISGSNAQMLSSELATLLSGRFIEVEVYPFSFKEFIAAKQESDDKAMSNDRYFLDFMRYGAFPETLNLVFDSSLANQYLEGIFNTVLVNDIVERHAIRDASVLKRTARFLFSNIGSLSTARSIANTLTSAGQKTSDPTVENYLDYFIESYLFYRARRFDIRGKEHLKSLAKYYTVDIGLRNQVLGYRDSDRGHILENIVYLELLRRDYDVSVGKIETNEIDFVATRKDEVLYIQVAETVLAKEVLERELAPLKRIPDFHPRMLLSQDLDPNVSYDGIAHCNIVDWLLGDSTE